MTQVLGKHNMTWLGGSWLRITTQTFIFHIQKIVFLAVRISDYLQDQCFLAFFFCCVSLLNSITAISTLAGETFPSHSYTGSSCTLGCRWRTQQRQRHCQTRTVRNILPASAEGQPLQKAVEQGLCCCLQFTTHLQYATESPFFQLDTSQQVTA